MIRQTPLRCTARNLVIRTKRKYHIDSRLRHTFQSHHHVGASSINGRIVNIPALGFGTISIQLEDMIHQKLNRLFNKEQGSTSTESQILACSVHSKQDITLKRINTNIITRVVKKIIQHAKSLWDILMVLFRTSEIGIRLSPLIILTPAAILASQHLDEQINKTINVHNIHSLKATSIMSDIAWKYTLYTIQKLGPAFIKVSQWASTRRDVFPSNVCDRLSELNDATFLHSWDHTHQVLTQTLGEGYEKKLKVEKEDVIGSGSVAQVYCGIWDDGSLDGDEFGGSRVAVKVLHPNIQDLVERDLLLMKRAADMVGKSIGRIYWKVNHYEFRSNNFV